VTLRIDSAMIVLAAIAFAGCTASAQRQPQPDMAAIRQLLNCPGSRTPTCIQHLGKTTRCYCADQDALQELLDPPTVP